MSNNNIDYVYSPEHGFYIPCLTPPEPLKIGKYGRMRLRYPKEHHKGVYTGWLISGKLNAHLEEIDHQAEAMMERLIAQMVKTEGITEQLKADDQMEWVRHMNGIRARAEEIVLQEVVYA